MNQLWEDVCMLTKNSLISSASVSGVPWNWRLVSGLRCLRLKFRWVLVHHGWGSHEWSWSRQQSNFSVARKPYAGCDFDRRTDRHLSRNYTALHSTQCGNKSNTFCYNRINSWLIYFYTSLLFSIIEITTAFIANINSDSTTDSSTTEYGGVPIDFWTILR